MVYKGDQDEDDDDNDASFPPLLKRLPKDFGAAIGYFDDDDYDEEGGDFGMMIVKPNRDRSLNKGSDENWKSRSDLYAYRIFRRSYDDESEEEEGEGEGGEEGFSTFVVKSTVGKGWSEAVIGTVVRRVSGGNVRFGGTTTMGRIVASMQAIGEMGGGKQKKGSASSTHPTGRNE